MQPLEVLPNDFPLALFFPANTGEVWGIECSHLIFSGSGVLCLTALFASAKSRERCGSNTFGQCRKTPR